MLRSRRSGLTLIELIVAFTILLILSSMALPLAGIKVQREKERLLRQRLSEIRKAIDRYKDMADAGKLGTVDPDTHGYPESLEMLVEGTEVSPQGMGGLGGAGIPGMPGRGSQRGGSGSGFGNRSSGAFGGGSRGGGGFGGGSAFGGGGRGGSGRGGSGMGGGGAFGGRSGGGSGGGFGSNSRGGMGRGGMGNPAGVGTDDEDANKIRFLRRIPVDSITGFADWGMRSVQDEPESMSWGGRNVFDVYSKSMDMALDGTFYRDW